MWRRCACASTRLSNSSKTPATPAGATAGLRVGHGIAGRVADDSEHSVCEPAPIRDRVGDSIGYLEGRVEVCDYLSGGVGSDNATQSSPVRKVCVRPFDAIAQTPIQCGGR